MSNKQICQAKFGDPFKKPISDVSDANMASIMSYSWMASQMKGTQGKRVKSLTRDTSLAIQQTCNGIRELTEELLGNSHENVLLGEFTTDYLEAKFGEFRQGSGGAYFITVQNLLEKLHIYKTRFMLHLDIDVPTDLTGEHACFKCNYNLDDRLIVVMDNLLALESSLPEDVVMCLVYIAGFLSMGADRNEQDTRVYYESYGSYFKTMNRGGLTNPSDKCCQWTIFCYIVFFTVKYFTCRTSPKNILSNIT